MSHNILQRSIPKIAVVGAGIFGITTSLKLSERGYAVTLYEKNDDILQQASGINQYRLHAGYHYPRCISTAHECRNSRDLMLREFSEAVIQHPEQYYCISKTDSLITAEQYLNFLDDLFLPYHESIPDMIRPESVQLGVLVNETRWDPYKFYHLCWDKLRASDVKIALKRKFGKSDNKRYDWVITATYKDSNELVEPEAHQDYKFELCEKPVMKLPSMYRGRGVVILDGPFMCIDPLGDTEFHTMGHVVHAIHATNRGKQADDYEELQPYLNRGLIQDPRHTHIKKMIESASIYFNDIEKAEHLGSMFTHRVVLPDIDDKDSRPTIVRKIGNNIISIFSGKIPTCVKTAENVCDMVEEHTPINRAA